MMLYNVTSTLFNIPPSISRLLILHFCIYFYLLPQLVMCIVDPSSSPTPIYRNPLLEFSSSPEPLEDRIGAIPKRQRESLTVTNIGDELEFAPLNRNLTTETVFDFPKRNSRFMAVISFSSWYQYVEFAKSTCRDDEWAKIMEDPPNHMESGYFSWEENQFYQELKKRVFTGDFFPETSKGNYEKLMMSPLSKELDPRLFMPPPKSFCASEEDLDEQKAEENVIEKDRFEDVILNRVFTVRDIDELDANLFEINES